MSLPTSLPSEGEGPRTFGEIVNPSDPFTIETTDWAAACLAVIVLGQGRYALREAEGRTMPLFFFGGHDEWLQQEFGKSLETFLPEVGDERLAAAFDTVLIGDRAAHDAYMTMAAPGEESRYEAAWLNKERSSLNDIAKAASAYSKSLRKRAATPVEGGPDAG